MSRNFCAVLFLKLLLLHCVESEDVTWKDFMPNAKWVTNELAGKLEPYILQNYPFNNVSEKCTKSLILYSDGLKEWEPWAIKMFDATGKFPSGFMSGTNLELGSFDDCIAINVNFSDLSESFKGQYCIITLQTSLISPLNWKTSSGKSYVEAHGYPPKWIADMLETQEGIIEKFGLYLGICMPSSCSEQDLYNIISALSKHYNLEVSLSDCQVDEPQKWSGTAKFAIFLILLLTGACALGTTFDIQDRKKENILQSNESFNRKLLKAFSLYTNSAKLFEVKKTSEPLDSVHGLRFWMCVWVILAHIFVFPHRWKELKYTNFLHTLQMLTTPSTVLVENSVINVEGFFLLSGFFMTYTLWTKLEKSGGKLEITENILQKYWRLTPPHVFIILLAFAVPVLYKGPIWNSTWDKEVESCTKYGWMNLLYIHNFVKDENMCWVHTWYLGVLMQVQIISLFLLVLTYKHPKTGIAVGLLIIFGCIINDFNTSTSNGFLLPSLISMKDLKSLHNMVTKMYTKPFQHFASHAIGMLLGWIVLKHKDRKLNVMYHVVGWILFAVFSVAVLFAVKHPTKNIRVAAVHNAIRNILWALPFSWLVYTCTTGSAGVLGKFLSFKIYSPLSQISYFVYLLHPVLLVARDASLKQRAYMGKFPHFVELLALLLASFLLSFIAYLMVEAPFNAILDLRRKRKSSLEASSKSSTDFSKNGRIKSALNGKSEKEL